MPTPNLSSSFLEQLAQQSEQIIFAYEVDNRQFRYLNPAFERLFGQALASFPLPEDLLTRLHPEDVSYAKDIYEQVLGEKK